MSVLPQNAQMTIAEAVKAAGYDGFAQSLGELGRVNEWFDEVIWQQSSHGLYNKAYQAKILGKGAFGKFNAPMPVVGSQGDLITEPVKLYEGDSQVDDRILKGLQGEAAYKVRDSQDAFNLEGMSQDYTYNLVYANLGDGPDGFKGIMARRPTLAPKTCIGFGGTASGALTSMLLFEFNLRGFYLTFPETTGTPGFDNEDRGLVPLPPSVGSGYLWTWVRHYEIWGGIALRDDRAMIRLPNLNPAGGTGTFASAPFLKAKANLPSRGRDAVAFATRNICGQIDDFCYNKVNIFYGLKEIENYGPITMIGGIPLRVMEPLLETESQVA